MNLIYQSFCTFQNGLSSIQPYTWQAVILVNFGLVFRLPYIGRDQALKSGIGSEVIYRFRQLSYLYADLCICHPNSGHYFPMRKMSVFVALVTFSDHRSSFQHCHFLSYADSSFPIQTVPFLYRQFHSYTDSSFPIQTVPFLYRQFLSNTDSSFPIQTVPFLYRQFLSYTDSSFPNTDSSFPIKTVSFPSDSFFFLHKYSSFPNTSSFFPNTYSSFPIQPVPFL